MPRWKLTEAKFKKMRKRTLILCSLALIVYIILVKYTMNVNPEAFVYNPMTDPEPPFAKIQSAMWKIIIVGWIAVIILFAREVHKNPKHWFRKFADKFNELDDDEKEKKEKVEEEK